MSAVDAAAGHAVEPFAAGTPPHAAVDPMPVASITSLVESIVLRDADGDLGTAWTFAYTRTPVDVRRPVLFLFNGGPGCASLWLHLSGLGPWRADVPTSLSAPVVPSAAKPLVASADSLLDVADLIFIDPIGTGHSRVAEGVDPVRYSGVERDAALTGQIIRRWLARHDRLASPVFLLGESYGTIRAALTATVLRQDGCIVSGVAFLGQCLNAQETTQRPGNPAGFIAALPLLAATAWFHGKGAHGHLALDEVVDAAHAFAVGEYARALWAGVEAVEAGDGAGTGILARLAGFTGLTPDMLRARRLRIDKEEFRRLLLADEGRIVALTDTRYTIAAPAAASHEPEVDAVDVHVDPVVLAARHELFTRHLGVREQGEYLVAVPAHGGWDYQEDAAAALFGGSRLPSPFATFDYPRHLAALLRANPHARLFFGTGQYDALTTVGSLQHLLTQYGLPRGRIAEGRYPAGHMMYTDPASLRALADDLRGFLRGFLRG